MNKRVIIVIALIALIVTGCSQDGTPVTTVDSSKVDPASITESTFTPII
jgi:PBP1b-binding outer membrane lipoprotein LpoB